MTTKKRNKVPSSVEQSTINACLDRPMTAIEPPKSNAVKLTEQLEATVAAIEYHRGQHTYHSRAAETEKERLHVHLLNHAELRAQLTQMVSVPNLAV